MWAIRYAPTDVALRTQLQESEREKSVGERERKRKSATDKVSDRGRE